ncbi:Transcription elongation factor tfiis [Thalictrum thalictroides]|uniref:Transcription elongation factor n=1 Tax=Thalictrum thalictroides TaxID=46969 RepID=A0A7J6W3U2_THATH|nr:Transcription elongation factor tfiis [Thalictrum thalictroides]
MKKEEILELFESAKKAADAATDNGAEESRCVEALKQLKKVPVTMQVLVETQVGKRLRHLTKHPREKIQTVASDLLEIWKKIVLEESKNKSNGSSEPRSDTKVDVAKIESVKVEKVKKSDAIMVEKVSRAETIKVEKSDRSEIIKSEKVSRSETVRVEKISTEEPMAVEKIPKQEKEDSGVKKLPATRGPLRLTSMIKCNDSIRDKTREQLAEAFAKVSSEADEDMLDEVNACDPIRVAVSVESALFEKLGRCNGPQKNKYRSIMFNIRDQKNPDLRRRVLIGHVKPDKLITMTPEEMASDEKKEDNNNIRKKYLFDCERGGPQKATTDQFKCGRCGQRKTTYYQLQTRSADEPMTTFVTCVNCNNHWKFC